MHAKVTARMSSQLPVTRGCNARTAWLVIFGSHATRSWAYAGARAGQGLRAAALGQATLCCGVDERRGVSGYSEQHTKKIFRDYLTPSYAMCMFVSSTWAWEHTMLTQRQIAWAKTHDWFVRDNGDGRIVVADRYSDGTEIIMTWHLSFRALRNWAGY